VSELSLATVSGEPVLRSMFPATNTPGVDFTGHISLGEWADALVVAPATANTMAKLAAGLCDDMLTACFITLRPNRPVLIFPAMDGQMFLSASVQRNVATLAAHGCHVFTPESGELASGLCGLGRMAEPEEIATELERTLDSISNDSPLSGLRIVVTAGPTRERIDGVRFISNYSSGKMGFAIARAAAERGATVTLISGPVHLGTPPGVERIDVESASEMNETAERVFSETNIFIGAAAVADYRPAEPVDGKVKKGASQMEIRLVQNPDILGGFGAQKSPGQLAIGFALEEADGIEHAHAKLEAKNLDLIAFNTFNGTDSGFEVDTNILTLIIRGGETVTLTKLTKEKAAGELLNAVERLVVAKEMQP